MISEKKSVSFITTVKVALSLMPDYMSDYVPETLVLIRVSNFTTNGYLKTNGKIHYPIVSSIVFLSQRPISAAIPEITMEDVEVIQAAAPLVGQFNALLEVLFSKRGK